MSASSEITHDQADSGSGAFWSGNDPSWTAPIGVFDVDYTTDVGPDPFIFPEAQISLHT
ncbi:MAG: hypothetical protein M0R66_07225 [Candidatus Omnitrophica bacterium]|jgi:hypothetical protein|nr:hypothetical protein [Candidatus Omnitrophota bacterium]